MVFLLDDRCSQESPGIDSLSPPTTKAEFKPKLFASRPAEDVPQAVPQAA